MLSYSGGQLTDILKKKESTHGDLQGLIPRDQHINLSKGFLPRIILSDLTKILKLFIKILRLENTGTVF
jgi:hypothetical protein